MVMSSGTLRLVVRRNVIDISDERTNSMSAVAMEAVRFIATYPSSKFAVTFLKTPTCILAFM